tara:strand:+ start:10829 stop:11578 length:750 start_codon:yes stop_codon:yes gene_type:complete
MNRRHFVKSISATGLYFCGGAAFTELFKHSEEVRLPSLDGELTLQLPQTSSGFISSAHADTYNFYNHSYQNMAPYQNMVAYNIALQEWRRQLYQYQMQRYQWIQQQHIQRLQQMMTNYSGYQIGNPSPWDSVRSIYGFAVSNNKPTLFGLNSNSESVQIQRSVQGAGAVFRKVGEYYNQNAQEQVVGPQSSESPAKIVLPNGSTLDGNGYQTQTGGLAVSNEIVRSADGKVGQLAKYKLGKDGNQYLIV